MFEDVVRASAELCGRVALTEKTLVLMGYIGVHPKILQQLVINVGPHQHRMEAAQAGHIDRGAVVQDGLRNASQQAVVVIGKD